MIMIMMRKDIRTVKAQDVNAVLLNMKLLIYPCGRYVKWYQFESVLFSPNFYF